jgi:ion channel-forming bestrophin family protein
MIQYNPKDWITFIFKFHKSDTIRQLFPLIILIAAYSYGVTYLELYYWKLTDKSFVKNISIMHGILSFVISMLLVFRTNTAYDRWWEGRKLWGSLVNSSRNLAIKLTAILDSSDVENRQFFKKIIPAYAHALRNHLNHESTRVELFEDEVFAKKIQHDKHVPNQIASMLFKRINLLQKENKITGEQLLFLNTELVLFTDVCGACERIKNTPIPYSYSAFIKKFIFFFVMTLPLGYAFSLGYLVIPVVCFVFYVLASLELIAEEIEDPFGNDSNDLPMLKIANNIHKHVYEIL